MMKKILAGLIASLVGIFAVGCRNHNADGESGSETPDTAAETTASETGTEGKGGAVTEAAGDKKQDAKVTTTADEKSKGGAVTENAEPVVVAEPEDLDAVEEEQQKQSEQDELNEEQAVTEETQDGEQHFDKDGSELL